MDPGQSVPVIISYKHNIFSLSLHILVVIVQDFIMKKFFGLISLYSRNTKYMGDTGWPVIHGRVFLVPCKTWLVKCKQHVIFYEVPEQHGHVYLAGLYNVIKHYTYFIDTKEHKFTVQSSLFVYSVR